MDTTTNQPALTNGDLNLNVSGLNLLLRDAEDSVRRYGLADTRAYLVDPADVRALRDRVMGRT